MRNGTGLKARETIRIAVLAAGESRRFGAQKLLATWRGQPLLSFALAAAQRACPGGVLLVTGSDAEAIEALGEKHAIAIVRNPEFAEGIGTSIAVAARACSPDVDALLIALADQPLVSADHLQAIVAAWDRASQSIVATAFAGALGPPVLFGRAHFATLSALGGDRGARHLLHEHRDSVVTVEFPPAAIDVDTSEDLASLDQADSSKPTYS